MKLQIIQNQEAESFKKLTQELINNYFLKVNNSEIELCDLEFNRN